MTASLVLRVLPVLAISTLAASCGETASDTSASAPAAQVAAQNAPSEVSAQDPAILEASRTTPEAFIRALYGIYADGAAGDRTNQEFYSARTSALRDEAIALNGYLDFDPILIAQDWDGLAVRSTDVVTSDAGHATVETVVRNFGRDATITFALVKEAGGWRIDDIASADMPSLRARLEDGNARDRAAAAKS